MKNFLLIILFVPVVHFAAAQGLADSLRQSHYVIFADSSHGLIHTELINHGHVTSCSVQICRATDLMTGKVVTGLRFADRIYAAFVDADEVPSFLAAMQMISTKIIGTPPVNGDIVCFRSRSGFEAGCYAIGKNEWQLYLQLKRNDNNSVTTIKKADLDVLLQILNEVNGQLN